MSLLINIRSLVREHNKRACLSSRGVKLLAEAIARLTLLMNGHPKQASAAIAKWLLKVHKAMENVTAQWVATVY